MQSESWSRVTLDGAGWLRAEAPGTAKVVVGASPVILVSENPPPQA